MSFWESLQQTWWVVAIQGSPWTYAALVVLHFSSVFLLVCTSALVDLRLLGLAARHGTATRLAVQFSPWTWTALGLAVLSGIPLFGNQAPAFAAVSYFWIKLLLTLAAAVLSMIIQRQVGPWEQSPSVPAAAKLLALISLLLWFSVLYASVQVTNYAGV